MNPDRREDALDAVEILAEQSRKEDGAIRYRAMTDIVNPDVVRFFEQYEDVTALETHTQTAHYREWLEILPELVAGRLETIQFELDEAPEAIEFDVEEAIPNTDASE